ncbi:MAG: hypothetical protein A3D53_02335 [Candidatus Magasanikbacteria bacterium RIFCSPHIGHO2_02_FULL_45_10]|uniref:Uncharacterized protein n=1 Tax=Candidatus Magasanikbacteria bacterium RIFCSPHIGHO2_02_FULL_45_10 TaxID=1798679 RepID=A0A1F6MAU6_9BACT|nr:MAG: hypothetical protein A3D53_02335 [Candidatus Magasanikbacteria bacterium RIFCSPHIGHO2_02_FULL_45_10]
MLGLACIFAFLGREASGRRHRSSNPLKLQPRPSNYQNLLKREGGCPKTTALILHSRPAELALDWSENLEPQPEHGHGCSVAIRLGEELTSEHTDVERDVVVPGEGQVRAGEEPELLAFPGGSERDGAGDESPPEHHVKLPQQVGRQDQPVEMVHRPIDLAHSRLGPDRGRERPRPVEAYVDAPIETEQLNARHLDRVNVQDKRERIVPIVLRLGKPRNQGRQNEHHRQHPHLYVLHGFPRYRRLMRRRNWPARLRVACAQLMS